MKKLLFFFSGLIFFILSFSGLRAETVLLSGSHTVTYDIINPRGLKNIPEYSNQSYSQKIISGDRVSKQVRVEIRLSPLPPSGPFPIDPVSLPADLRPYLAPEEDIPSGNSRMIELAKKITQGSATATEAYNRIIDWVMDTLEYEINTPQDAISVLKSKKGSCVGFSNLSLTLLRASGFPARYVSGYLPPGYDWGISRDYWGVKTSGGGIPCLDRGIHSPGWMGFHRFPALQNLRGPFSSPSGNPGTEHRG